jgi:DNA-binding MarR family transcriptional regulator
VSTLVSRLVEKGLITRRTDPDDGRVVRLTSTSTGRSRVRRWRQYRLDLIVDALTALQPSERDALRGAVPALRRLAATIGLAAETDPAR